jgi:hypothetical protein
LGQRRILWLPHVSTISYSIVQRVVYSFQAIRNCVMAIEYHVVADVVVVLLHCKHITGPLSKARNVPIKLTCNPVVLVFSSFIQ